MTLPSVVVAEGRDADASALGEFPDAGHFVERDAWHRLSLSSRVFDLKWT